MQEENKKMDYKCPKCSSASNKIGKIRVAGSFWSKIFNIQGQNFVTVTCAQCGYTELYKASSSGKAENILDFLTN